MGQNISAEMLLKFRRGMPEGLSHVFSIYFTIIYLFTRRLVKDQFEAEDITITALQKLLSSSTNFQTEKNIKGFLYTTAKNAAFDYLRAQKRKKKFQMGYKAYMPKEEMPKTFENNNQAEETTKQKKIEELPKRLQNIIKLIQMGCSNKVIATEMKVSLKTVRNYKSEAYSLLGLNKKRAIILKNKSIISPC